MAEGLGAEPTIGERVRFWQEQDRINKALIPRVLKMHELVTGLEGRVEQLSLSLPTLEAREVSERNRAITTLRQELQAQTETIATMRAGVWWAVIGSAVSVIFAVASLAIVSLR